jgi:C-terminal processing protease CtpA/Prc
LKAGDIIVAADGEKVSETGELVDVISEKEEGEKVKIDVIRDHKSLAFEVEVEKDALWSSKGDDPARVKIFSDKLNQPGSFWLQGHSSDLREEMDELKEELKELKEDLRELKDKLR